MYGEVVITVENQALSSTVKVKTVAQSILMFRTTGKCAPMEAGVESLLQISPRPFSTEEGTQDCEMLHQSFGPLMGR